MASTTRHPEDADIPSPSPRIPNGAWKEALLHRPRLLGPRLGDVEVVFEGEAGGRLSVGDAKFLLPAEIRVGKYE